MPKELLIVGKETGRLHGIVPDAEAHEERMFASRQSEVIDKIARGLRTVGLSEQLVIVIDRGTEDVQQLDSTPAL